MNSFLLIIFSMPLYLVIQKNLQITCKVLTSPKSAHLKWDVSVFG